VPPPPRPSGSSPSEGGLPYCRGSPSCPRSTTELTVTMSSKSTGRPPKARRPSRRRRRCPAFSRRYSSSNFRRNRASSNSARRISLTIASSSSASRRCSAAAAARSSAGWPPGSIAANVEARRFHAIAAGMVAGHRAQGAFTDALPPPCRTSPGSLPSTGSRRCAAPGLAPARAVPVDGACRFVSGPAIDSSALHLCVPGLIRSAGLTAHTPGVCWRRAFRPGVVRRITPKRPCHLLDIRVQVAVEHRAAGDDESTPRPASWPTLARVMPRQLPRRTSRPDAAILRRTASMRPSVGGNERLPAPAGLMATSRTISASSGAGPAPQPACPG